MKGWLLVFRTEDSEDREDFVRTFLETTSQQQQLPAQRGASYVLAAILQIRT